MDDEKQPESTEASSLCCLHAHDGLFPTAQELPPRPLPAIERNYTQFFITGKVSVLYRAQLHSILHLW